MGDELVRDGGNSSLYPLSHPLPSLSLVTLNFYREYKGEDVGDSSQYGEYGFPTDDGYDYTRHFRNITGGGVFVPAVPGQSSAKV